MVDVRFELTTSSSSHFDDAICQGMSPLGHRLVKRLTNRLSPKTRPQNILQQCEILLRCALTGGRCV